MSCDCGKCRGKPQAWPTRDDFEKIMAGDTATIPTKEGEWIVPILDWRTLINGIEESVAGEVRADD